MAEFEYGPVELYLVGFEGDRPDDGTLDAIRELVEGGEIRLIDLLVISREDDGSVLITDYDEVSDEYGFGDVELAAIGLVADEDVAGVRAGHPAGHLGRAARDRAALGQATSRRSSPHPAASSCRPSASPRRSSTPHWPKPKRSRNMPFRRMGRPGLVGMAARTAVVAGTATAVSGGVRRRQAEQAAAGSTSSSSTRPSSSRRR